MGHGCRRWLLEIHKLMTAVCPCIDEAAGDGSCSSCGRRPWAISERMDEGDEGAAWGGLFEECFTLVGQTSPSRPSHALSSLRLASRFRHQIAPQCITRFENQPRSSTVAETPRGITHHRSHRNQDEKNPDITLPRSPSPAPAWLISNRPPGRPSRPQFFQIAPPPHLMKVAAQTRLHLVADKH